MINTMVLAVAVISFGVVRYSWLSPHATEKMAFIGDCHPGFAEAALSQGGIPGRSGPESGVAGVQADWSLAPG